MQLEEFNEKANKAIIELEAAKPKEAMMVHHDDADGLCSAAITKKALEREEVCHKRSSANRQETDTYRKR